MFIIFPHSFVTKTISIKFFKTRLRFHPHLNASPHPELTNRPWQPARIFVNAIRQPSRAWPEELNEKLVVCR
jgi:hypothetical protein